ncbi:MAG: hypothetical protein VKI83_04075 [Synechococcaceae cyanobacterium]|nr:hypothetical protein [Synechococcaceae cyanobacterium]
MAPPRSPAPVPLPSLPPALAGWIKTPCGRAKYLQLAARSGPAARLRLVWFVLAAALRDLPLQAPREQP